MMVLLSVNKYADVTVDVDGQPAAEQEMKELRENYVYYMIAYAVGLGVYIITLMGACMYSSCLVSTAILYSLFNLGNMIYFGINDAQNEEGWIFGYIVWPIVWSMLYIYPHAVFISEVNKGIMSPKTVRSLCFLGLVSLSCLPHEMLSSIFKMRVLTVFKRTSFTLLCVDLLISHVVNLS